LSDLGGGGPGRPNGPPLPLNRVAAVVDRSLATVLVVLMAVAVLNVLWQVFTRFVLGDPSSFTEELARYLLIWIGLLGAAYATGRRLHPAIGLLTAALSKRGRRWQWLAIQGAVLVFAAAVMVFGGGSLVSLTLSLGQTSAALRIPLGYVYLALPVGGLLIVWYAVLAVLRGPAAAWGAPTAARGDGAAAGDETSI
jgi:TRAP-type C4-dicarboxylate transport system permease small subunit